MNALNYGIFALTCKNINVKTTDAGEVVSVKWAFVPGARPERKFIPERTPLLLRAAKVASASKDNAEAAKALRLEFSPRTEEGQWLEPVMLPCQKTGNLTVDPEGLTTITTKFFYEDLRDVGFDLHHILGDQCSICLECNPNLGMQDLEESASGLDQETADQPELGFEYGDQGTVESDPDSEIPGTTEETTPSEDAQDDQQGGEVA